MEIDWQGIRLIVFSLVVLAVYWGGFILFWYCVWKWIVKPILKNIVQPFAANAVTSTTKLIMDEVNNKPNP